MREDEKVVTNPKTEFCQIEGLTYEEQKSLIVRLFSVVDRLLEENQELRERVSTLEEEVRRLRSLMNKDSHNSDNPPSSDKFKRIIKSLRQPSEKPSGGQKGHKGHALTMVEKPDNLECYPVTSCSGCEKSLENTAVKEYIRGQVFEPPEMRMVVTEHRAEVKDCPHCGMENKAKLPIDVVPGAQYGVRAKAFMAYFNQYQEIPYERTCEIFYDIFSQSISEGTLDNANKKCYESLEGFEQEAKRQIIDSPVAGFDETGVSCEGKPNWMHAASTSTLTHYAIHDKRGGDAMDSIGILPNFKGRAVHDGFKAYDKYACDHSLCNTHHLRTLTFAHEEEKAGWASEMKDLLLEIKAKVDDVKGKSPCLEPESIKHFEEKYQDVIKAAMQHYPVLSINNAANKRGKKKQSKGKNLLDRLSKHDREVLAFMYDFRVPFDNNLTERDIRMMKLKMKISGTFRSSEGAKVFCRIRSYISTVKKNGMNILEALQNALLGRPYFPEGTAPT